MTILIKHFSMTVRVLYHVAVTVVFSFCGSITSQDTGILQPTAWWEGIFQCNKHFLIWNTNWSLASYLYYSVQWSTQLYYIITISLQRQWNNPRDGCMHKTEVQNFCEIRLLLMISNITSNYLVFVIATNIPHTEATYSIHWRKCTI